MTDPTHSEPDRLRLALDRGEVVELDGGTLVVDNELSPSIVLRLPAWRARALAEALDDWSAVSRIFNRPPQPTVDELDLSRILHLAAIAAGDEPPTSRSPWLTPPAPRGAVPPYARIAALAVLNEREPNLTDPQRIALIDAASWWLTEPINGPHYAHALLEASCRDGLAAEHAYLALITPTNPPGQRPSS